MDTKLRSLVKSIMWRVIGIALLGVISYLITRSWKEMSVVTALFHGIRVIMYYYHERLWERISWGRVKHPLSGLPVRTELTPKDLHDVARRLKELGYID